MVKLKFTFVFVLFLVAYALRAQLSAGGTPVSFLYPSLAERVAPSVKMPPVDEAALRKEDAANALLLEKPFRFGKELTVQLNPDNSGAWELLPGGDKLWRVGIESAGARTINLIFSRYKLPAGAQLFIYNADHSEIIGAFTDANNQEDGVLGTTLVNGDRMVVEYYEPARADFRGQLEIGSVVHGYRTPGESEPNVAEDRGFGASGSCNINVNCPLGDGWNAQKRSAVKIVNGGDWCSGAMINNTNNNGTPYLLTANHCYASSIGSWVFWFNYQAPTCPNPSSSPAYNSISGSTLKARRSNSDFCLLQLNSTPPLAWDVFYSGWNRGTAAPTQETGIHHPSGDIKKISRDNNAATNGSSGGWGPDHWRVYWDQGVTEGGSSGSPLYDQNKRIIGQLHGGASYCGASAPNLWDEYGKFSESWDGTAASKRLRDWLNPANNATTNDGYSPTGNYLLTGGSNGNVADKADTYEFEVYANVDWKATSYSPWIRVSESNTAAGILAVQFDQNESVQTRTGTIQLTGTGGVQQVVTLTQFGAGSKSQTQSVEKASLYPNPTNGTAILNLKDQGPASIAVFDTNGRMILQTRAENRLELQLNNEPNGIYFVRITQNGATTTLRLTIQR